MGVCMACCQLNIAPRPQTQPNVSICDVEHKPLPKQTNISTREERYVAASGVPGLGVGSVPLHCSWSIQTNNFFSSNKDPRP